LWGVVAHW